MSSKEFIPSDYCDESSPSWRAHPNDWLIRRDDGSVILAPYDLYDDDPDPAEVAAALPLIDGHEQRFYGCERLGSATLAFKDGGWVASPDMPPRANLVVLDDGDMTSSASLSEIVESGDLDSSEEYELTYFDWVSETWVFHAASGTFELAGALGHG